MSEAAYDIILSELLQQWDSPEQVARNILEALAQDGPAFSLPEGVRAWHVDHIDADGIPIPGALYVPEGYTFGEARELGLLGHVCDDFCEQAF